MFTQGLYKLPEDSEPLVMRLTMKITVVNLLYYHSVTPVTIDLVEGKIRGIDSGSLLVEIQNLPAA